MNEAVKENPWAKKKYLSFVLDNTSLQEMQAKDDLFNWDQEISPKSIEETSKSLVNAYTARSGAVHGGKQFPVQHVISRALVPASALANFYFGDNSIPPIEWMERITNLAIVNFIYKQIEGK